MQGKKAIEEDFFGTLSNYLKGTGEAHATLKNPPRVRNEVLFHQCIAGFDTPHILPGPHGWVFAPEATYSCMPLSKDGHAIEDLKTDIHMCIVMVVEAGKIIKYW